MDFKYLHLRKQYALLHPKLQQIAVELDLWLTKNSFPVMIITHIYRTPQEQEAYYWKSVMESLNCSEPIARETARAKFSWHRVYCALDIRNSNFDDVQRTRIYKQLKTGRDNSMWEILQHDVGRGDHFHVGYKDFDWRHRWSRQLKA